MKTKEEIIAVIEKIKSLNIALSVADYEAVLHYLKLSTLNPMRIDEERMNDISMSLYEERISPMSDMKRMIDQYNSTCKDHQVLQPLPSEMPELFGGSIDKRFYITDTVTMDDLYQEIRNHYGTPTKKELVSVLELHNDIRNKYGLNPTISQVVKHFHDTYSLNPPKREWWDDLKENDIFMMAGVKHTFSHIERRPLLYYKENVNNSFFADLCTPYIEPSIHDKFMASLSDEQKKLYDEMKEVKGGM